MDHSVVCSKVVEIARAVGAFIKSESGKVASVDIETKYKNNFVSYVDKQAEEKIVQALRRLVPEAGFIVEEGTVERTEHVTQWVIDPLDGTTNFLHELPSYAVSIALQQHGETTIGVVYEINKDECFYAYKDGGSFLNGKKIEVSKTGKLEQALISTGFPYYDFEILDEYISLLKFLMRNTGGIRRYGAAAVDLCYVACGRYDAFFEHSLAPWDVAAGALIIDQAGGFVTDFAGGTNFLFGRQILGVNGALKDQFLNLSKEYLTNNEGKT